MKYTYPFNVTTCCTWLKIVFTNHEQASKFHVDQSHFAEVFYVAVGEYKPVP